MSTFYYMICRDHKERVDACSMSGHNYGVKLADSDKTLMPFIATHHGCDVSIVSEHDDEACDESYKDWTAANYKDMYMNHTDDDVKCQS